MWVVASPGLSGVGNQKFCLMDGFSEVFRISLMYVMASSESSSVSTLSTAVLSGLSSFASSGDIILNSAIVVFLLMV